MPKETPGNFMLSILALAHILTGTKILQSIVLPQGDRELVLHREEERLVELTEFSDRIGGLMCFQVLGFLCSFVFFSVEMFRAVG